MWRHTRRNQIWSFARNGRVNLNRPGGRGVSSVDCWQPRCAPSAVVMLDTPIETWRHMRRNQISSFARNGPVNLNRPVGVSSVDCWQHEVCGISGSNVGYSMFRGSVKGTGYPLHSPVSPSLSLPCVTVCHHISTGIYHPKLNWILFYFIRHVSA